MKNNERISLEKNDLILKEYTDLLKHAKSKIQEL